MAWLHDPMRIIFGVVIIAQIIMAVRLIKLRDFIEEVNTRTKSWKSSAIAPPPEPEPEPSARHRSPTYLHMRERENSPRRICPIDGSICFAPECMAAGCQEALDPPGAPVAAPSCLITCPIDLGLCTHYECLRDGCRRVSTTTRRIDESIQSTCKLAEGQPLHRDSDEYRVHHAIEEALTTGFVHIDFDILPGQRSWLASHIIKQLEHDGFGVGDIS